MDTIQEEYKHVEEGAASAAVSDSFQIGVQLSLVQVVGSGGLASSSIPFGALADRRPGPGIHYLLKVSGTPVAKSGGPSLTSHHARTLSLQFNLFVPAEYPARKLEFSFEQAFNISKEESLRILAKINEEAARQARGDGKLGNGIRGRPALELCFFLICKSAFDPNSVFRNVTMHSYTEQGRREGATLEYPDGEEGASLSSGSQGREEHKGQGERSMQVGHDLHFEDDDANAHFDRLEDDLPTGYMNYLKEPGAVPKKGNDEDKSIPLSTSSSRQTIIPYPRTCSFAWSSRGQLVTFAYHKYDLNRLKKSEEIR